LLKRLNTAELSNLPSDQIPVETDVRVEEDSPSVTDNSILDGFKSHEIKSFKSGDNQAASSRKATNKRSKRNDTKRTNNSILTSQQKVREFSSKR